MVGDTLPQLMTPPITAPLPITNPAVAVCNTTVAEAFIAAPLDSKHDDRDGTLIVPVTDIVPVNSSDEDATIAFINDSDIDTDDAIVPLSVPPNTITMFAAEPNNAAEEAMFAF